MTDSERARWLSKVREDLTGRLDMCRHEQAELAAALEADDAETDDVRAHVRRYQDAVDSLALGVPDGGQECGRYLEESEEPWCKRASGHESECSANAETAADDLLPKLGDLEVDVRRLTRAIIDAQPELERALSTTRRSTESAHDRNFYEILDPLRDVQLDVKAISSALARIETELGHTSIIVDPGLSRLDRLSASNEPSPPSL